MAASQQPWREELLAGEILPSSPFYDNPRFARACAACGRRFRPTAAYFAPDTPSGALREWCRLCDAEPQRHCPACDARVHRQNAARRRARPAATDGSSTPAPEPEKRCSVCRQTKPLSAFNRDRSRRDGRQGHCRDCAHRRGAAYRARMAAPRGGPFRRLGAFLHHLFRREDA
jgi:hypothetical protein